jgi:phage/plasmid-associated DNA primase
LVQLRARPQRQVDDDRQLVLGARRLFGTIGIESFLDQGIKKRGDAATPDLAKLGGVRMLRASEPERGAKLNSALIKAATGGEPMSVRALHRGFFDLFPRFKLQHERQHEAEHPRHR